MNQESYYYIHFLGDRLSMRAEGGGNSALINRRKGDHFHETQWGLRPRIGFSGLWSTKIVQHKHLRTLGRFHSQLVSRKLVDRGGLL